MFGHWQATGKQSMRCVVHQTRKVCTAETCQNMPVTLATSKEIITSAGSGDTAHQAATTLRVRAKVQTLTRKQPLAALCACCLLVPDTTQILHRQSKHLGAIWMVALKAHEDTVSDVDNQVTNV